MTKTELSIHDKAVLNCVFNPNLPLTEAYNEELNNDITDNEVITPKVTESKALEQKAIKTAENGDLKDALIILNEALEISPNRASIFNNRAQVYQFMGKLDDAFLDLSKAIEIGKDCQFRSVCQAYCQRGLLHRKFGRDELARTDFESAAKLGSLFAKSQLVELNPYAALCNQMLRKVMDELK